MRSERRRVWTGTAFFLAVVTASCGTAHAAAIVALEWLPQSAHGRILKAYEDAADPEWPKLKRVNVMGSEVELASELRTLPDAPSTIIVSFGQNVAEKVAELRTKSTHIILLSPDWPAGSNVFPIISQATAESIWKAAADLEPDLRRLGVVYTARHAPSEQIAARLEQAGKGPGRTLVRGTVQHGMCRTESDFEKAVQSLRAAGGCDVLYVPDDPNTSRFAATLLRLIGDIPVIGGEALQGRGCAGAFVRNYEGLGRSLAGVVAAIIKGEAPDQSQLVVPPQLVRENRDAQPHK